jgi:hypothetical protein
MRLVCGARNARDIISDPQSRRCAKLGWKIERGLYPSICCFYQLLQIDIFTKPLLSIVLAVSILSELFIHSSCVADMALPPPAKMFALLKNKVHEIPEKSGEDRTIEAQHSPAHEVSTIDAAVSDHDVPTHHSAYADSR